MNKEEIVEILAAEHGLSKSKVNDLIRSFLTNVTDSVVNGEKVTLVGFGIFEAVDTKARVGHNPTTGDKIQIAATRRPKFTAGRSFRAAVRGATNDESSQDNA
jgi:DNA-binding protein HU-beta